MGGWGREIRGWNRSTLGFGASWRWEVWGRSAGALWVWQRTLKSIGCWERAFTINCLMCTDKNIKIAKCQWGVCFRPSEGVPAFCCHLTNYSKTLWLKSMTILLYLMILWIRDEGGALLDDLLLHMESVKITQWSSDTILKEKEKTNKHFLSTYLRW